MTLRAVATSKPAYAVRAAIVALLLLKLYFMLFSPPIGDEAYYWMWGQKPAWSYLDHPPLNAWLLGLSSLLGWSIWTLRLPALLTLAGNLWIFWLWAKRLQPDNPAGWWWSTVAIYLATPLLFLMSSIAFNDHLLVFLCLAAAHLFLAFAEKWTATGHGFRWLYAAAIVLGLAVLTKYNAVLFAVGVAAFFALHAPLRPLWRSPHLYLAALLAIVMQAPVLGWNVTEGFASFNFHMSERWNGTASSNAAGNAPVYLLLTLLLFSPFLFSAITSIVTRRVGGDTGGAMRVLALSVFLISTIAMLVLSLFVQVAFYWNIVALVPMIALVAGSMRRWLLALHVIYGLIFAVGCTINFTTIPLENLRGGYDWTTSSTFGWPAVASRIAALKQTNDIGFVVASRYTTAAQLGFAMHDPDVVTIAQRHDQYDYWFTPADHIGQNALVVGDPVEGVGYVEQFFDSLTPLETVPFAQYGYVIYEPKIWLGTNFHMPPGK